MQLARLALRRLAAGLALTLVFCSAAAAQGEAGGVLLARPQADPELADLAAGYALWLSEKLSRAELAVMAAGPAEDSGAGGQPAIAALEEQARASGATVLVVPELRLEAGVFEVRLPVYAVATSSLLGAPHASAPLATLGTACEDTAARLLTQLGVATTALPPATPPGLDELASSGRALRWLEAGDYARAWREVEGKLSPTAMRLREDIAARAQKDVTPLIERARVLAVTGDGLGAWTLLAPELARASQSAPADPRALLAAAQAQLARNDGRAAQPWLEQALAVRPDDPEAHLELGHAKMLQGDAEGARAALARSAELDPTSPAPLLLLAEIDAGDPRRQAEHLLAAGRREAGRLNAQRAEHYFERAIDLDPEAEKPTLRAIGALNLRVGRPTEALAAFDAAREAGDQDAEVFAGMGVAQRRLGRASAEASLRRALTLQPDHGDALRELAELYTDKGRSKEAVPLLERALAQAPERDAPRRALAAALRASGDAAGALRVLADPGAGARSAASFGVAAQIHREQGNLPAAHDELQRALALEPHDATLRSDLAAVLEAQGDAGGARQARQLALVLDDGSSHDAGVETRIASAEADLGFDALVEGFAVQVPEPRKHKVALLGLREPASWERRLRDWVEPRLPDVSDLAASLERDLGERFQLVDGRSADSPALRSALDQLYAFESEASVSSSAIANVVTAVGTDAIFVARLVRRPAPVANPSEVSASCADPKRFEIEVRMLSGSFTEAPAILVDMECLAGGLEKHGVWNARAAIVYLVLGMLLIYPVLRGWGTIVVQIKLPPQTKGFLRIRISAKPEKVQDAEQEKQRRAAAEGRLARSLSSFSRYVKHMAGRETVFRWIPARKRGYVVTVRGPLQDAMSGETIGHFLEEQRVQVVRGRTAKLEYDFCPDECAVEIVVSKDGQRASGARVAVRGDLKSLRYAREGTAFEYLRPGRHTILIGYEDRACERAVELDGVKKAVRLTVDLGEGCDLAFQGCPAAVDPYLLGDFSAAASLLEAAGDTATAALLRAGLHRERGDHQAAASEFEAAGRLEEAAEMHASGSDFRESAELFERAGNHARAAETYRAGGDPLAAARCYEAIYDYNAALECYDEAGEVGRVIDLLEKTGAYLDAGRRAHQIGDADSAMRNLQQIERRDPAYGEACLLMSELLAARGDADLAATKLAEAIEEAGGQDAPSELHERYALLLEQAGQREQALEAYQLLRRRDPARGDVTERIATLRRDLETTPVIVPGGTTRPPAGSGESRYEILAELGRGGMGVVYQARDKRLGRVVALKRLPENLRSNPAAVELFLREAQAAAMLNHRNIVTLFDAGEEDGIYFISMELLEGMPLNAIAEKRGRLSALDTARLGIQIANGLQYAHERRIVHRDIKTANLFFTRDRVVKIMDFGLAKTIEEVRRSSTMIGGTPYYMAPEQAAGEAVDHRTDLYAFGVTMFRLVTGSMPFTEGDLAYHHRHTPAPDARELDAGIPEAMALLLAKLLAKQPEQRCQSAAEVAAELQALLPPR
jgi:tetratricopeptide (TPR) repeat protein